MKHPKISHEIREAYANPASSLTPLTVYEWIKITFMTISGVAPCRFVVIIALVIVGSLLARVGVHISEIERGSVFFEKITHGIVAVIRTGARVVMFTAGFVWVFTKDDHDPRAHLLVSTHSSMWDSIWLLYHIGATQAAKTELFAIPLIGNYLRLLNSIPIDRNSDDGRRRAIVAIQRRVSDPHSSPIVIFPTACCTNSRQLIHFKRGAFEPKCPIQPIGISYPSRHYDLKLSKSAFWDLYRTVCQFTNYMAVTFLPLRIPSEAEQDDPGMWSAQVREEMALKLGMRLADFRYEDEVIRTICRDNNVFYNGLKLHIVDFRLTQKCVDAFAALDADNDGWLSVSDIQATRGEEFFSSQDFQEIIDQIKLPPIPPTHYLQSPQNIDSWTEEGFVGILTGGRPKLVPRPIDLHCADKLELADIVAYFNRVIESPQHKTVRIQTIHELFGVLPS